MGAVGPDALRAIYAAAAPGELGAIIVFSILWGFGGVGFGQAIKRVGIALGTNIVMGIIVVIGRGLHSFPLLLNLSLPCRPFPLKLSSLRPPYDPH